MPTKSSTCRCGKEGVSFWYTLIRLETTLKQKPAVKNEYFDNTMVSDYKQCPRYFFLRHVRGWRREGKVAEPLAFGLAWHEAMDVVWTKYKTRKSDDKLLDAAMLAWNASWTKSGHPDMNTWSLEYEEKYKARTPMVAREMIKAYIEQRRQFLEKAKLHAAETPFAVPIFTDLPIYYIGRIDKHIELNGDQIALEHKTTSDYRKGGGFDSRYLESWSPSSQIEGYIHQSQHTKKPFRYVWVDAALVHKQARAFKFIPVSASTSGMDAWLWEVRDWVTRITSERRRLTEAGTANSHMTAYPRNTGQCSAKFGLCTYINICRSVPNPAQLTEPPAGFVEDRWAPFDLLGVDKIMKG